MIIRTLYLCVVIYLIKETHTESTKENEKELQNSAEENKDDEINNILQSIAAYVRERLEDKITDLDFMENQDKVYLCATGIQLGGLKHFNHQVERGNDDSITVQVTSAYEFDQLLLHFDRLVVVGDSRPMMGTKVQQFSDKSQPLNPARVELVVSYRRNNDGDSSTTDCSIRLRHAPFITPVNVVKKPVKYHETFTTSKHNLSQKTLMVLKGGRSKSESEDRIQVFIFLMAEKHFNEISPAFFTAVNDVFRDAVENKGGDCAYKGQSQDFPSSYPSSYPVSRSSDQSAEGEGQPSSASPAVEAGQPHSESPSPAVGQPYSASPAVEAAQPDSVPPSSPAVGQPYSLSPVSTSVGEQPYQASPKVDGQPQSLPSTQVQWAVPYVQSRYQSPKFQKYCGKDNT